MKLLLDAKADSNMLFKGKTPLMVAAQNRHKEVVKLLISKTCPSIPSPKNWTPTLFYSAFQPEMTTTLQHRNMSNFQ